METEQRLMKAIIERVNEIIKIKEVNNIYQSFSTKDKAEKWIINQALITLVIPIEQRLKQNN